MRLLNPWILLVTCTSISCSQSQKTQSEKSRIDSKEHIIAVLDTIWRTEQEPLRKRDSIGGIHGIESEEAMVFHEIYKRNHEINETKVRRILDTKGWPKKEIIGEQGNLTLCNVIQHSSNEIRLKYVPMMRKAVMEKQLHPRFLVRTEDRIATEQGKPQLYGGQMKYYPETKNFNVWPVYDPANINKRRAEIGLGPIEEYLKMRFNFEWNLDEQLKRTTEFLEQNEQHSKQ